MDENETKPTLAAGMSKRSFWIAIAAAIAGTVCRFEVLERGNQGLIALGALALGLIAIVFAAVALIRITHADSKAVLVPGLCGLALGIYSQVTLVQWAKTDWVRARTTVATSQDHRVLPPAQTVQFSISQTASKISYLLPAFDAIPGLVSKIRSDAAAQSDEDAAVTRAWGAHLERFRAVYTNTFISSNKLHQIDLLDPKLITDFNDNEAIRRRRLANDYADAWRKVGDAVNTFSGSYYEDLRKEQVSPDRTSVEARAIMAFVQRPETAARIELLRALCKAEELVGNRYNYSVSAVFDYGRLVSRTPNPPPQWRTQMDEQIRNLRQAEQGAAEARRKAFISQ